MRSSLNIVLFILVIQLCLSCTSTEKKIIKYINDDDMVRISELSEQGFSFNDEGYQIQPLDYALENNKLEVAELLINLGADPTYNNSTLLDKVAKNKNEVHMNIIVQSDKVSASTIIPSTGESVIYWFSKTFYLDSIAELSKEDWDFEETHNGNNIIFNIYKKFRLKGLESLYLLNSKAYDIMNEDLISLLGLTFVNNDLESSLFLLKNGASFESMSMIDPWFIIGKYWTKDYDDFFIVDPVSVINIKDATVGIISGMIMNKKLSYEDKLDKIKYFKAIGIKTSTSDDSGMDPIDYLSELIDRGPYVPGEEVEINKDLNSFTDSVFIIITE